MTLVPCWRFYDWRAGGERPPVTRDHCRAAILHLLFSPCQAGWVQKVIRCKHGNNNEQSCKEGGPVGMVGLHFLMH